MKSGYEILALLERNALAHGEKPAFIEQGRTTTYREFLQMVQEAAMSLARQGAGPETRITFTMGNNVTDMAAGLGIILAGACLIPMPPDAAEAEQRETMRECLATHTGAAKDSSPEIHRLPSESALPLPEALEHAVIIRPTSGTTGRRKGVILSADSVTGRIEAVNQVLNINSRDVILWTLPVSFHLVVSIMLYLSSGATVVLAENQYPDTLMKLASCHSVTVLYAAPRQFSMLASDESGRGFPALRWAISTGTFLPDGVAPAFEARFGHPLRQAYGLIEVGLAAFNASTPPAPAASAGTPVPGHEIMICDKEGCPLPEGSCGEIMIRGPGMFRGYVNPSGGNCADGWFASGDTGVMEEGVLFIRGRSCSVIHVAGMKVFPEEIEACLMAHPAVESARVYAISHKRMGQITVADIQALPGGSVSGKELYLHCRRYLSPWKIPVEFNVNTRIIKTAGGKTKR